ncbi:PAS domain-containing hybrid sensor histidine kinase/response regulator [Rhodovulum euryhalinum]|nr:PAS domain-containing hybrid sensor histidine kinase/response regulator [Rhodovulum euryhalinum]
MISRNRPACPLQAVASRRTQAAIAGAMLALLIGVIAFLSLDVMRRVDSLATAHTDNVQWTFSAVTVELVEFENALLGAERDGLPLDEVRRRFDILYNRADIATNGTLYSHMIAKAGLGDEAARLWQALDAAVPLIDGPDAGLAAALPSLRSSFHDLRAPLRTMAIAGVRLLAVDADGQRATVARLLTRLALVTSGLVVLLLVALVVLGRLNRDMGRRAQELQMLTSRLCATVRSAIDAVIVADDEGRILDFNPAAEAIFGYRRDEILGQRMHDMIVPDHVRPFLLTGMERFRETGQLSLFAGGRVEMEARRKSGEVFPAEISVSIADSRNGKILVSFLRDISDRKAAEADLTRARDDALAGEKAKANLLAVMSHEMRTPLNGMLGAMELMRDTALDAEQREHLTIMDSSGRLLLHHVNDVLDIAHLDSGRAVTENCGFDLAVLLDETVAMHRALAAINGNRLLIETEAGLGPVLGDARRLRQILVNLIGNALKFTRQGTVTLTARRPGGTDMVEIAVRDTGIGISPADRERIFDEFFTADPTYGRRAGGTGLGLAITDRLVRLLGGEIAVDSTPGAGSVFAVRLRLAPLAVVDPGPDGPGPDGAEIVAKPLRLLLVEDNRVNRRVARALLERLGHRVTEAEDGIEGVEKAFCTAFDAILMDVSMPRLDGVEATRRIRLGGRSRHARIVALTAHAMPHEIEEFRFAGMDEVGSKPVSRGQLAALLAEGAPRRAVVTHDDHAEPDGLPLLLAAGKDGGAAVMALLQQRSPVAARLDALCRGGLAGPDDGAEILHAAAACAGLGALPLANALDRVARLIAPGAALSDSVPAAEALALWRATAAALASADADPDMPLRAAE